MPRKARIDALGALHHIIIRGIEGKNIFQDDVDRDNFLNRLGNILIDTSTYCFAWALMPNHVHLLLRTGSVPIATVMRRLLTGYAISYNRRHRRHGQLFQNRYKSILCQEDPYLLELVRYIHLNPLRSNIVSDMKNLDNYLYSGHIIILGNNKNDWQNVNYVLRFFAYKPSTARRSYRAFVEKGAHEGRKPNLVGGGLIRSAGGWAPVKALRKSQFRVKGDERILGDGNFVESILKANQEKIDRRYSLEAKGYDFNRIVQRVAELLGMGAEEVLALGKHPQRVKARSLLCFWSVRELGMSMTELGRKLGLSQPTVSISTKRGERIAYDGGFKLTED